MPTCTDCGREGSRGFTDGRCNNAEQCAKRQAKAERARLADRCVDCLESGDDPRGARKLALKDDGTRQPGPRCVTHWRARRKDVSSNAHASRLAANFELTPEQYWALYAAQNGKCFVCAKSTGKARRLAVDHDHVLAKEHDHDVDKGCVRCIRALLCKRCNTLIGYLDVEALRRAIVVLTEFPARKVLLAEPTAVPPTLDGVTVDPVMSPEPTAALENGPVTQAEVDDVAAELGLPAPEDLVTPDPSVPEPTFIETKDWTEVVADEAGPTFAELADATYADLDDFWKTSDASFWATMTP